MKGYIIVNRSGFEAQSYQAERLKEEFNKLFVDTEIVQDGYTLFKTEKSEISKTADIDFAVVLDKDKYLLKALSRCGIRLFNSAKSIEVCDDKGETYIALLGSGVNLPKTIFAPLCYRQDEKTEEIAKRTANAVISELNFPIVVKESYGSMGTGVYLARTESELIDLSNNLALVPHIYQEYLAKKVGTDVRVIVIGGKVACAIERYNTNDFRSNLALGGVGRKIELRKEFKETAEKVSKILGLDYCGVDILYGNNDEPIVCEVNSNAFFKGAERITGVNIAKTYAEYILNCIKCENT